MKIPHMCTSLVTPLAARLLFALTLTAFLHGCGGSSISTNVPDVPVTATSSTANSVAKKDAGQTVAAKQQAITIDGDPADMQQISPVAEASAQNAATLKAVISGNDLYLLVQGSSLAGNYNFFFNTDGNAQTGNQNSAWTSSGADYLFSNGTLYRSTGSGWSWQPIAGDVAVAVNPGVIEARVALQSMGVTAGATSIGVGFQLLNTAWALDSQLPNAGAFAQVSAESSFAVGKGMIIPAYIPLSDLKTWNILAEGAALMRDGSSRSHKDYWVTVNSDRNGPFTKVTDWSDAKVVWDPIRTNGGRIFGYIHTLVDPESEQFRPLADVKADIAAWVAGYPNVDGIWIDEFYPRYEIAPRDGAVATFPNGNAAAPVDRSFLNSDGRTFNAGQVNPAGGYYDQLTQWIRATYPRLRVIGNAGGHFYSNQVKYGELVDVLVSFEQTLDYAMKFDIPGVPAAMWGNLYRQNLEKTGQLSLVHTNSTNLVDALNQSFALGYSHVFTTDRVLNANIWGGIPPYLMTEIQLIANRTN